MIDELRALAIFSTTVDAGSFRKAAKALRLSPSVVSHHIAQLEKRLGVTLLYRSTRQISLSKEGRELYVHAKEMILTAQAGLNLVTHQSPEPAGRLQITLPAFFARSPLIKDIAAFVQAYPKIELSLSFTDQKVDLIREGIDLAIRIGELQDSALTAKRLFDMPRKLIVAPSYLKERTKPKTPADLLDWDWVGLKMRSHKRILTDKTGKRFECEFAPKVIADSVDGVCQLAVAGLGLATPPAFLVETEISNNTLIDPLKSWSIDSLPVFAVWPKNISRQSLTFRLLSFLEARVL